MKILCNKGLKSTNQKVKQIGKYLYNHIDGAFKYRSSSNVYDVYLTLLYQIPYWDRIPGKGSEYNDVHEMTININLTTYQNKIRVNTIEMTPNQKTLGYDLFSPEKLQNMEEAIHLIYNKVKKRISKAYSDYDFLF